MRGRAFCEFKRGTGLHHPNYTSIGLGVFFTVIVINALAS